MITYVEDDILFTDKPIEELEFVFIDDQLEVCKDSVFIGYVPIFIDKELEFALIDDNEDFDDLTISYIYFNNEVTYLYQIDIEYQENYHI